MCRARCVLLALLVVAVAAASSWGRVIAQSSPVTAHAIGTVETLAGPRYCDGMSTRDPESTSVGRLAVDPDSTLYVETGNPSRGLVAKVTRDGRVSTLVTGVSRASSEGANNTASALIPDGTGGVVVAADTRLIDVAAKGGLRTIAGSSGAPRPRGDQSPVTSGVGGPASEAQFSAITSLASDGAGNIFVAELLDRKQSAVRIRFINRSSQPITLYPGTAHAVTVEPGYIDTIAGTSGRTMAGDGGSALQATLVGTLPSLAATPERLYIGSYRPGSGGTTVDARVRMINLTGSPMSAHGVVVRPGEIQTVAGGGFLGRSPDHGATKDDTFSFVPGMATDLTGTLYLADEMHQRVRKVDRDGLMTTVAGSGSAGPEDGGFNGNDQPAIKARLNRPHDVRLDGAGRLYISDQGNGQVRVIDQGGFIHVAPGSGVALNWSCGGVTGNGTARRLHPGGPISVAWDGAGNGYFANADEQQIKRLAPDSTVTTLAGTSRTDTSCPPELGCRGYGGDGGPSTQARFDTPNAMALTPDRDIYLLDSGNARVRFINRAARPVTVLGVTVAPGTVATVVGNGSPGMRGDGGPARQAQVAGLGSLSAIPGSTLDRLLNGDAALHGDTPSVLGSLALDPEGDLFIADTGNHRVRLVTPSGTITTFAGQGALDGRQECCSTPQGLAVDPEGNLYVSDLATGRVWLFNRTSRPILSLGQTVAPGDAVPVAGNGIRGLAGDGGRAVDAQLLDPLALALDRQGRLFIAETVGTVGDVREVDSGGVIRTVLGNGRSEFNGDGLVGRLTTAGMITGLAVDACGSLLFADLSNERVRRLNLSERCRSPSEGRVGPVAHADEGSPPARPPAAVLFLFSMSLVGAWLMMARLRHGRSRSRLSSKSARRENDVEK